MGRDRKNWVFTFHLKNVNGFDDIEIYGHNLIQQIENMELVVGYYSFGYEEGSQKTPHFQGYIQFEKPQYLNVIKEHFGKEYESIHWEPQKSRHASEADAYTRKEGRQHWQGGSISNRGDRNDLNEVFQAILTGQRSFAQTIDSDMTTMIQYGRRFRDMLSYKHRGGIQEFKYQVISVKDINQYDGPNVFVYSGSWAGYDGQKDVIIFMDKKVNLDAMQMKYPFVNNGFERIPFYGENVYLIYSNDPNDSHPGWA